MRYPEKKPRQCVTVDHANGTIYCYNTQQRIVEGTCKACRAHYGIGEKDGRKEESQATLR